MELLHRWELRQFSNHMAKEEAPSLKHLGEELRRVKRLRLRMQRG